MLGERPAGPDTDTDGMRPRSIIAVVPCVTALVMAGAVATGGEPHRCRACGPRVAGMETPYGDTGCGPRYRGEIHEPSRRDPCDACNRWSGCRGGERGPDMLAPWQLPPGRGFMSAAQVGYDTRQACRRCQH